MTSLQKNVQSKAYRIVMWQLVCIAIFAFITAIFFGIPRGVYFLMGGLTYGLSNLLFVAAVFRFVRVHQMHFFVAAFVLGEILKLFLSGILFIIIVKTYPNSLSSALAGLIGAIVSFWIVSWWQFATPKP